MSPNPTLSTFQTRPQLSQETQPMSFTMNRFLDVAVSVLIVCLAAFTAGATAVLGA